MGWNPIGISPELVRPAPPSSSRPVTSRVGEPIMPPRGWKVRSPARPHGPLRVQAPRPAADSQAPATGAPARPPRTRKPLIGRREVVGGVIEAAGAGDVDQVTAAADGAEQGGHRRRRIGPQVEMGRAGAADVAPAARRAAARRLPPAPTSSCHQARSAGGSAPSTSTTSRVGTPSPSTRRFQGAARQAAVVDQGEEVAAQRRGGRAGAR